MDPEVQNSTEMDTYYCPECGTKESGFFCRNCGKLLRGEDNVLCPRCRQVVPGGEFCHQCGQDLGGIALSLGQLAMAGDAFWVTDGPSVTVDGAGSGLPADPSAFDQDEAELPDWLRHMPAEAEPPDNQPHIYPSLEPVGRGGCGGSTGGRFLPLTILLLGLLLLAMMIMAAIIILRPGG